MPVSLLLAQQEGGDFTGFAVLGLLVVAAVFFMAREISCWYFKTNEMIGMIRTLNYSVSQAERKLDLVNESLERVKTGLSEIANGTGAP